jgi:hypothetical protein
MPEVHTTGAHRGSWRAAFPTRIVRSYCGLQIGGTPVGSVGSVPVVSPSEFAVTAACVFTLIGSWLTRPAGIDAMVGLLTAAA